MWLKEKGGTRLVTGGEGGGRVGLSIKRDRPSSIIGIMREPGGKENGFSLCLKKRERDKRSLSWSRGRQSD